MEGLRGREPLGPNEGLLLTFPIEDEICIVNDGVAFDLDVAYASAAGEIVAVERAVPAGDASLRCHGTTRDVLEVASGRLDGVSIGDRLER